MQQPDLRARRPDPVLAPFSHTTTAAIPARNRLEYWRHLFFGSYIDLPDRAGSSISGAR
jgi:hypothetical protein